MNTNILNHQEIQNALVDILVAFSDYCDKNNLKYVLCCGTLLGAIRHHGMIPWDDDIDVSMPREDYEKLNELLKTNPIDNRYFLESLASGNSPNPFGKLFDRKYELVDADSKIKNNIWIDIFPVDGISENDINNIAEFSKKIFNYCRFLEKSAKPIKLYGLDKSSLKKTVSVLLAHFHSSYYYGRMYSASICWNGVRGYLLSERYFTDRVKVEFEGHSLYAPQDWDEYLIKFYGDYMKIPPESERETHNIIVKKV